MNLFPRIRSQLLDTKGKALLVWIDVKNNGLDFITLFVGFSRILNLTRPRNILHVNQAINTVFDTNKDTKRCHRTNLTSHNSIHRILVAKQVPWVDFSLLKSKGDSLIAGIDLQHDGLDFVANIQHLGRMLDLLGPRHFGNVDQAFNTSFQLDKSAIISQRYDLATNTIFHEVTVTSSQPWVLGGLFHAQGNTLALGIELQDLNPNAIPNLNHFGRMVDSAPRHVGDVQQAINTTKVDKAAVVGDVHNDAFHNLADFQSSKSLGFQFFAFLFQQYAT